MTNPSTATKSRLLVDYSKAPAPQETPDSTTLKLRNAALLKRQRDKKLLQQQRRRYHIPDFAATACVEAPKQREETQRPVTFRLKRGLLQRSRSDFLGYMKNHFSTSDLDLEFSTAKPMTSPSSNPTASSNSSHNKAMRRDTLKHTLIRSQSLKQFHLDCSPLTVEQRHSDPLVPATVHIPRATKKTPLRSRSDATSSATVSSHYLPAGISTSRHGRRRGMLGKQRSFVVGSKIRRL
jgi:hypothetical protein